MELLSVVRAKSNNVSNLYFGGIFGGNEMLRAAAQIAVDDINDNEDILHDYKMKMIWVEILRVSVSDVHCFNISGT